MPKPHRTMDHGFRWLDPTISTKGDGREPYIWLEIKEGMQHNCDVYLVNQSDHTLTSVKPSSGGVVIWDDEVISLENNNSAFYEDIKPGEAVLVDRFNKMTDDDLWMSLDLIIQSDQLGRVELSVNADKGDIKRQAILWSANEVADGIKIRKLS